MPPKWRDSIRNQSHYTTAARAKSGGGCAPPGCAPPPQPPATPLLPGPVVHLNVSFFRDEQSALYTYTQCSSVRPSVGRTPNCTMAHISLRSPINALQRNGYASWREATDWAGQLVALPLQVVLRSLNSLVLIVKRSYCSRLKSYL